MQGFRVNVSNPKYEEFVQYKHDTTIIKYGDKLFSNKNMYSQKIYAIDTESVGVGPKKTSSLARVTIVNETGAVVLDAFCKPSYPVSENIFNVSRRRTLLA